MLLDVHLNVDFDVVPFSFERCLDLTNENFGDLVCGFTEDAGLEVLLGLILTTGKLVDSVLDGVHDASFHRRFHYTPCNLREISHQQRSMREGPGCICRLDILRMPLQLASTTVRTQIGVIEKRLSMKSFRGKEKRYNYFP